MKARAIAFLIGTVGLSALGADDLLIADFEGTNYGGWQVTGTAFGAGPARGTLPGQMRVEGYAGRGLVNSFSGGDRSTGTLTSPTFKIERPYISFLIGGGGHAEETCVNLLVEGKPVRTATGPNTASGGSEQLQPGGWEVAEFKGREGRIEIVDRATGGWGHINVDQIAQTERKPALEQKDVTREISITGRYLHFPVKNGARTRKVEVLNGGEMVRFFDIRLADEEPDWWAFLDVTAWKGQKLTVKVDRLREGSHGLGGISQENEIKGSETLYREPLRPQLHFSARRGWLNDPNGLVFYKGEYHLFFQHNPYGWDWGNMHWGHAVSTNLVNWRERGEVLYPDRMGPMFSGSAVVDWKNTSGFGKGTEPPIVLFYTAAGNPAVQCLAYSSDGGRTFTKYEGNPVVRQFTPGNRDPKVIWHEESKQWVMVLYVGFDENKGGKKSTRHTIHFLTSPNLKEWTVIDQVEGLFECPDFFPLQVEGEARKVKWLLNGASSEYLLGSFDGKKFTAETPKLPGHRGKGFYAAQTFSDMRDGRRIQIGWLQAPSPGMAFNQCMSLPLELKLISTTEGPRLTMLPTEEVNAHAARGKARAISEGAASQGFEIDGDLPIKVTASFEPGVDSEVKFSVRDIPILYNAGKQELVVNGHRAAAPLRKRRQEITVFADRTTFEVFASDGLTYVPVPVISKQQPSKSRMEVSGAPVRGLRVEVIGLPSIHE